MRIGLVTMDMAILVDRFNLRPWEIARLTERQIRQIYFHPRDKDGTILVPMPKVEPTPDVPATYESTMQQLEELALYFPEHLMPRDKIEEAKIAAAKKYGKTTEH